MNEKANYGAVTLFCPTIRCCDNICPSAGKISANLAEKIFDNLTFENKIQKNEKHFFAKLDYDGWVSQENKWPAQVRQIACKRKNIKCFCFFFSAKFMYGPD